MKGLSKNIVMLAVLAVLVYLLMNMKSTTSTYRSFSLDGGDLSGPSPSPMRWGDSSSSNCAAQAGNGLASALLPREVAQDEDWGQFAPSDVLRGQSFMDPRAQIGVPETAGGSLRNANQSIRAEPPNKKEVFIWNNSTIMPDLMQRPLI
ncbi:hypothetical protein DSLPV1_110 [Dishui lake phycodnavirus 1]|uniref:hypothetical protein n=1 Tax=Dishui lake phycodnavirus 1 TaxID=2079134 RepID=UPI000CD6B14C|nr:hypothetical protein C5Y57_gp110 [Dishui lake phycodnavirus 1]AUT19081.1 hypothetical protein DSLPV1_110 [Dishui lake phycodnavirus 1]